MCEKQYSYEFKSGEIVPVSLGERLPFIDVDGQPCHTGMADRINGKRRLRIVISTWVGSVAITAVHYYARVEVDRVCGHTLDSNPDEVIYTTGYSADRKPKEVKGLGVKVCRRATQRDINHWMMTHDEEPDIIELLCPKIGEWETGFWEHGDAILAAHEFIDAHFIKDDWTIILDDL